MDDLKKETNIMNELSAKASEHFDDYLLVVEKDNKIWSTWRTKTSAYGMAQMVAQDIREDWTRERPC